MKQLPFIFFAALCFVILGSLASTAKSAVIQTPELIRVEAFLDGGIIAPDDIGETIDYLKFEVLVTSNVAVTATRFGKQFLMLAEFIGRDDQFGFLGNPYLLAADPTFGSPPPSFSRLLDRGIYVIALGRNVRTSYDVGDGFTPVNPEGGGFRFASYVYEISGSVRALEFWDGELNNTFNITTFPIPEPHADMLLLPAALSLLTRRKRCLANLV